MCYILEYISIGEWHKYLFTESCGYVLTYTENHVMMDHKNGTVISWGCPVLNINKRDRITSKKKKKNF